MRSGTRIGQDEFRGGKDDAGFHISRYQSRAGATVSGEQAAASKTELINTLKRQQINVTKMSEKGKEFNLPTFGGGVDSKELAVFTRQFSVMIDAGLPLVQCLEILAGQQENKIFQKVLTGTRAAVEGGSTLSAAMRQYEKVFDALYVNLVEAGETGGILDTILQRLSSYIEKNVKLKRAVKSALVYPVAVLSVAAGVIVLLLWKVVPIFATLFLGLGVDLPLPTRIVIGLSNFVGSIFGLLILVAVVGGIIGLKVWYGTPGRPHGHRSHTAEVASDGHPAAEDRRGALHAHPGHADLQRRAHPRRIGHHGAHGRKRGDRKGAAASPQRPGSGPQPGRSARRRPMCFPGMVTQMIGVGEQTGAMDAMLQKIADFYEDEVDAAVKDLLAAMEPMMIVFLGVVVGGIVISMYLPLFSLIGQLSSAH